ncbi:hypothetical protein [Mycobacterium sp. URHB0021]
MPISSEAAHYRATIAGIKRAIRNGERPSGGQALDDAKRGLACAKISDFIERVLAEADLTDAQRTALAEQLRPAPATGGGA